MILSILKVIGLILLVILCVLLVLILLILFVPVRYAAEFEYNDKSLRLDVKATWLLSIIRCYAGLRNKDFFYKVKALFFSVIDSKRVPKEKKKKTPVVREEPRKEMPAEEHVKEQETSSSDIQEHTMETDVAEEEPSEEVKPQNVTEKPDDVEKEPQNKNEQKSRKKPKKEFRFPFKIIHPADIYDKIIRTLMDFSRKLDKIWAQIVSEENRETVLFVLGEIKKLLYHIRPRKHGIYLKIGMKDPALTGQIIGAYSVLNSVFGMNFILEPYFDREVLEAKLYIKGHIRVISLIIIAIRLYRNKIIRKLIRRK